MNEWYALTNDLETGVPPLDEVSRARIEKRVRSALPRPGKRRMLVVILAAVLALSACGYAVATGQFSHWFWNMAEDPQAPESSEDLLASMGTVLGQSQTAGGVTVTLNGAIWDGNTLMLSLAVEGEDLPEDYWTSVAVGDSWLSSSKAQIKQSWQKAYPDRDEAELDAQLDEYWESMKMLWRPEITYLYNRLGETYSLQIRWECPSGLDALELTLHLENLEFRNTVIQGPFEFTFTVERHDDVELLYRGDVTMEPAEGVPIRVTDVTVSPFQVKVRFTGLEKLPLDANGDPSGESFSLSIDALRVNGEEVTGFASQSGSNRTWESDGSWEGSLRRGPFRQVIAPAAVEAICINSVWLELNRMELAGN